MFDLPASPMNAGVVAFVVRGEGLSPRFTDGMAIVVERGAVPTDHGAAVLELVDGRRYLVRAWKRRALALQVEHYATGRAEAFDWLLVACISEVRRYFFDHRSVQRQRVVQVLDLDASGGAR